MPNPRLSRRYPRAYCLALCETLESRLLLATDSALFTAFASFLPRTSGNDPQGLVVDSAGNLYGVTASGGAKKYGTVFKINATDSTHTIFTLDYFRGGKDFGISPSGNLCLDSSGHLFGVTTGGGFYKRGTIFEINVNASAPAITTLVSFNGLNGSNPVSGLVTDGSGNFFGTATGANKRGFASTVWSFSINDTTSGIHTLATFNAKDLLSGELATTPEGFLATDASGRIFGTTRNGGAKKIGSIFQLNSDHTVTTLVSFSSTLGAHPTASLIREPDGTFIGTALNGGPKGYGTLYQLSSSSSLTLLGAFNYTNGANPLGRLVIDSAGDIFGITAAGGSKNYGTVFERPAGTANTITTLYSLSRRVDGLNPTSLAVDTAGHFFISTFGGGAKNAGAIFELTNTPIVFAPPSTPPITTPPAFHLNILQPPAAPIATNQPFSFTVDVRDTFGNVAIVNGTASLSITSGPAGSIIAGSPTANIVDGVATFSDVSLTIPGEYILQISAPSLASALTNTITVT